MSAPVAAKQELLVQLAGAADDEAAADEADAAEEQQPDEEEEDDVRLIMRRNDQLVGRLLDSIGRDSIERPTPLPTARRRRAGERPPDSDLSLLEFLVGKTIGDYGAASSPRAMAPDGQRLLSGGGRREFNGAAAAQIGTRAKNRSSSQADWLGGDGALFAQSSRGRQTSGRPASGADAGEIGAPRLARRAELQRDAAASPEAARRPESPMRKGAARELCASRLECESGGECVVDDFDTPQPAARCRCPIGRGGEFCQKCECSLPKRPNLSR